MTKVTGRCLCGAVRYSAKALGRGLNACHCGMCQRWSGGIFLNATITDLEFEDEDHLRFFASSDSAERGFCSTCGSSLLWRSSDGETLVVSSGTLDDQSRFALTSEIYIEDKPPGYDLSGDHPRLTEAEFTKLMSAPAKS